MKHTSQNCTFSLDFMNPVFHQEFSLARQKKTLLPQLPRRSRIPENNLELGHLIWDLEDLTWTHFMIVPPPFFFFLNKVTPNVILHRVLKVSNHGVYRFLFIQQKNGGECEFSIIDKFGFSGFWKYRALNALFGSRMVFQQLEEAMVLSRL